MRPLLAVDVQYDDGTDRACAAAVWFADWPTAEPLGMQLYLTTGLSAYVPGAFYQRELPCVLPLVGPLVDALDVRAVIVDAHVDLGPDRPGLGRHLYDALGGRIRVVGVAKRAFHGGIGIPVLRGESAQPLWVTATEDAEEAAAGVAAMAGRHRLPILLGRADRLARDGLGPSPRNRA